jgi:hypothetical protein
MTQLHRWGVASAAWGLAWTAMLLGTAYDEPRWLAWGLFFGLAGVIAMVWVIAEHVREQVERQVTTDLGERDRRRTAEMAEALVRADQDGIRLVD